MAREDPQLKLRVTDQMRAKLVYAARANNRSVNAEIVHRIEESFARDSWLAEIGSDAPNSPEDPQAGSISERDAWVAALQLKPDNMSFDAFSKIMEESMHRATKHALSETIAKMKEAHDRLGQSDKAED